MFKNPTVRVIVKIVMFFLIMCISGPKAVYVSTLLSIRRSFWPKKKKIEGRDRKKYACPGVKLYIYIGEGEEGGAAP